MKEIIMNRYKMLGVTLGMLLCCNLSAMDQGVKVEITQAPQPAIANLNDLYNKIATLVGGLREDVDRRMAEIDTRMTQTEVKLGAIQEQIKNVQRVMDLLIAELPRGTQAREINKTQNTR